MKIAIITNEFFSTYIYNLAAGLYSLGFDNISIIKISKNLYTGTKNIYGKFKLRSPAALFKKIAGLIETYNRYKKAKVQFIIKQHSVESFDGNTFIDLLNQEKFDIIVAYNTGLLDEKILSIPKHGVICAHPALLPFGRGLGGKLQSVLKNVPFGVTVFRIDKGIDTGDIYLQEELDISRCRSIYDLNKEFSKKELELTLKTISGISQDTLFPKKQEEKYKYWKLTEEEAAKGRNMLNFICSNNKKRIKSQGLRGKK
jgi:folate-dependent phosphoribosylglycinamide formyltransferase PurN